jgi:ubiquinone/menaquinone biosynthesis C-methylase UbiE
MLAPGQRVLELGCGPGYLWAANQDRLPQGVQLTLTDFSGGMVEEAHTRLAGRDGVSFKVVDAQSIPYDDQHFDVVIANHMLYHVPDRDRALSEIRRVLTQPGGRFFASTVGEAHMQELKQLVARFDPSIQLMSNWQTRGFNLQTGGAQLARFFPSIALRRYEDELVITEVEPLVAFVLSSSGDAFNGARLDAFVQFVAHEMTVHGTIRVTKETGLFVCGFQA